MFKHVLIIAATCLLAACSTPNSRGLSSSENPEVASADPVVVQDELKSSNPKMDLGSSEDAEIPKEVNDLVLKWVDYFTGVGRKHMTRYLGRSSHYAPMMKEILKKNGVPEDLVYLALIESGFSSGARSHASAVGFWQFIRGTGRTYGLRVNQLIDERRDFVRSTEAASMYLKGLYNLFGSWYLAIASYNVGENRIKRVVMDHQTRDFWTLARTRDLPGETIDYVPKFIAARMIAKHPEKFGFTDVDYMAPLEYETIKVDRPVSLRLLSQNAQLDHELVRELNPMYRTEYVPLEQSGITEIRVPKGKSEVAQLAIEKSLVSVRHAVARAEAEDGVRKHRVRSGETLGTIARHYGVSLSSIRDANDLSRRSTIRVGTTLNIPGGRRGVAGRTKQERAERRNSKSAKKIAGAARNSGRKPAHEKRATYVVKKGDTLFRIATKHNVTLRELVAANRLKSQARLTPGRRIVIPE